MSSPLMPSPAMPSPSDAIGAPESCQVVGGDFANLVQLGLAVAAAGTLFYKRHFELPQRPWLIWFFDTSKQGGIGFLQHIVGLLFGVTLGGRGEASACAWYLLGFIISMVTSLLWLWTAMTIYMKLVSRYNIRLLRSGEYGVPPRFAPWFAQCAVLSIIVMIERVVTFQLLATPAVFSRCDQLAAWMESPMLDRPRLNLLVSMVLAPMVLNSVFFWICDNLLSAPDVEVTAALLTTALLHCCTTALLHCLLYCTA